MPDASKKPSAPKQGELNQQPPWKKHLRPDGSHAWDLGDGNGPIDGKIIQNLMDCVKRDCKGKTLAEKVGAFKKLLQEHVDGDTAATSLVGGGRGRGNYLKPYEELTAKLPKHFSELIPTSVKNEGDKLLGASKQTGYGVEGYNVAPTGTYADFLREGQDKIVYHQYASIPEHGAELLRRLQKMGIVVPYQIAVIGSTVAWEDDWQKDASIEIEKVGDMTVGRNLQYAIIFSPKDAREGTKLADFFKRNADPKKKEAIANSWQTPDVRSSFAEKVGSFQKRVLNVKRLSGFDLIVLKGEPIEGFTPSNIWLNGELAKFAKALTVFRLAPISGSPLVYSAAKKSIALDMLEYQRGVLVPVKKSLLQQLKVSLVVAKAFRYVAPSYRQGRPVAGYGQRGPEAKPEQTPEQQEHAKKQAEIRRVMAEQQKLGKVPLPTEEVQAKKAAQRKQVSELIRLPLDEFMRSLREDFGMEPDSENFKQAVEGWKARPRNRGIFQ